MNNDSTKDQMKLKKMMKASFFQPGFGLLKTLEALVHPIVYNIAFLNWIVFIIFCDSLIDKGGLLNWMKPLQSLS